MNQITFDLNRIEELCNCLISCVTNQHLDSIDDIKGRSLGEKKAETVEIGTRKLEKIVKLETPAMKNF